MDESDAMASNGVESAIQKLDSKVVQPNGHLVDERPSPSKPQSKVSEGKSQEGQLQAFEKQYKALQQQLRQRDIAMMDLADENEQLNKRFSELKESLKESLEDRDRHAEKIKRHLLSLQSSESSIRDAQAAVVEARREANEARRDANESRREATDTSVALADAKAEIWAMREAAKGVALGEDERRELEAALRALSGSAQRAAQEAGTWKESSESWKRKVDSLQEELDSKAQALAAMENELSLARQTLKDSEIRVQEAAHLQSVAELGLQELRQETDRRARTFNSAVKAAVSKIQADLEADREEALNQIATLQSDVGIQTGSLKETLEVLTKTEEELSDARLRIAELQEERQERKEQVNALQEQVKSWHSAAETNAQKADAAHEVADGLAHKLADLEARSEELAASVDGTRRSAAMTETNLLSEVTRLKSSLTSVQNEKHLLQVSTSEKMAKAMAEQIALRATITDLEGQLRSSRSQASRSGAKPDYRLDNLGLERVNWKNKLRHPDVEKQLEKKNIKDSKQPSTSTDKASWAWSHNSNPDTSMLRGRLSQRSIVMIVYIVALHIIVMISFTQKSQECVAMVEQTLGGKLPG